MSPTQILVVEDNRELAENLCQILEGLGEAGQIHIAKNGQQAVDLASQKDFHLALVDLHLPDMEGTSLLAKLRDHSPFASLIIITGDASVEGAIGAVRQGAFAYVLKPFRGQELLETANHAVRQSHLLRERSRLRDELERSERRHREVVEAMPAFVLALDREGCIVLWNRQLEEVTGISRAEVQGRPGDHLVGSASGERRLPLKDGGHRLVRWRSASVPPDGDPGVRYVMGIDVTDEREMMRRTLRAERLAAVGTLAAGLAHEVRNPLNSALLQLDLLERRVHKGRTQADDLLPITGVVKQEIGRLERLVKDFLDFARPRPLNMVLVPINDLVQEVANLIAPEATSHSVALSIDLDAEAGLVHVEPERLRQVLLNLFRNALEVMPQGGVLTLRTRGPDMRGFVFVDVEDTGPGFPEDAPVFDAFYTTKEEGTGLGLAIVHRIVTEHGGNVRVRSHPGSTCFTVELPQDPSSDRGVSLQ